MPKWDLNLDVAKLRAVPDKAREALTAAGDLVLADSARRVPVQSGELKRSGRVVPLDDGRVAVTYLNPIAAIQHERMDYTHPGGGSAKFLEHALNSNRDAVLALLADAADVD